MKLLSSWVAYVAAIHGCNKFGETRRIHVETVLVCVQSYFEGNKYTIMWCQSEIRRASWTVELIEGNCSNMPAN